MWKNDTRFVVWMWAFTRISKELCWVSGKSLIWIMYACASSPKDSFAILYQFLLATTNQTSTHGCVKIKLCFFFIRMKIQWNVFAILWAGERDDDGGINILMIKERRSIRSKIHAMVNGKKIVPSWIDTSSLSEWTEQVTQNDNDVNDFHL